MACHAGIICLIVTSLAEPVLGASSVVRRGNTRQQHQNDTAVQDEKKDDQTRVVRSVVRRTDRKKKNALTTDAVQDQSVYVGSNGEVSGLRRHRGVLHGDLQEGSDAIGKYITAKGLTYERSEGRDCTSADNVSVIRNDPINVTSVTQCVSACNSAAGCTCVRYNRMFLECHLLSDCPLPTFCARSPMFDMYVLNATASPTLSPTTAAPTPPPCFMFDPVYMYAGGNCRSSFSCHDFDADGDLDCVVAARGWQTVSIPGVHYYRNMGNSNAPALRILGSTCGAEITQGETCEPAGPGSPVKDLFGRGNYDEMRVECADFDSDGDVDCVFGKYGRGLWYTRNDGTPSSPAFVLIPTDQSPFKDAMPDLLSIMNHGLWSPACFDYDGDGDIDCVIHGAHHGPTTYVENTGSPSSPSFQYRYNFNWTRLGYGAAAKADLDGDGDVDLFIGADRQIYYAENTGTASAPQWATPISWDSPNHPLHSSKDEFASVASFLAPHFLDYDGDGDIDLITGDDRCTITQLQNIGSQSDPRFTKVDDSNNPNKCEVPATPAPTSAPTPEPATYQQLGSAGWCTNGNGMTAYCDRDNKNEQECADLCSSSSACAAYSHDTWKWCYLHIGITDGVAMGIPSGRCFSQSHGLAITGTNGASDSKCMQKTTATSACSAPVPLVGPTTNKVIDDASITKSVNVMVATTDKCRLDGDGYCCFHESEKGSTSWFEWDLQSEKQLSSIETKGRTYGNMGVEQYKLHYSLDGNNWQTYQENGVDKSFTGNSYNAGDTAVTNSFLGTFVARKVRLEPQSCTESTQGARSCCVRAEINGCPAPTP